MAGEHILVVQDEEDIQELVQYNLTNAAYRVSCVGSGEDALNQARSGKPDLMVLDLMLPGVNGLEVCRRLKQDPSTAEIPIIMLTARGEESDIVAGLELGADDYVTKPFSLKVLLTRIKAVLRRTRTSPPVEDKEIDKLKDMILSLGTDVEESVKRAVRSLTTRNTQLAMNVIDGDINIDQREVDVEEECLKILALYQPVAADLRLIIAILKINNDLERIADLAVNIAERAVHLSTQDRVEIPFDFNSMAEKTQLMIKKSLDAFVNMDANLAREVLTSDDEVDAMNREVYTRCEEAIRKNPDKINCLIQLLSAAKYLERSADHATNISEDVIYLVQGEIIRHQKPQAGS
jgi:phosphate transport system protein